MNQVENVNLTKVPSRALIAALKARGEYIDASERSAGECDCDCDGFGADATAHIERAASLLQAKNDSEALHHIYLAFGVDFWRFEELSERMK